ncbi:MAG: hypothetical protein LBQ90_07195, partial [Synergistaceae bacterium]|nr:hypothetical protein [Synergistaceae bacterium]
MSVLTFVLALTLALSAPSSAFAAPGDSAAEPIVVTDWSGLDAAIRDAEAMTCIELGNDIDAVSASTYPNDRKVTIDGKGHTIKSASASDPNTGLRFNGNSATGNAIVLRNLTFEDLQVGGAGGETTARNGSYTYGGGALSVRAGSLTIENCAFINNKSVATGNNGNGGAVFFQNAGVVNITNSTFYGNESARKGGAIAVGNSADA